EPRGCGRTHSHAETSSTTLPRVWPDIWYLQASGACDSGYAFVTTVRIAPASNSSASCLTPSFPGERFLATRQRLVRSEAYPPKGTVATVFLLDCQATIEMASFWRQ